MATNATQVAIPKPETASTRHRLLEKFKEVSILKPFLFNSIHVSGLNN